MVLDRLRTAELGADEPLPKIVRALGPAASASADVPAIADVSKQATVATLFRWRTVQSVRRLIEHDHLVRLGNPTGVHQARVATRRLRADLGLFQDLLPRSTVDAVRGELQWLGRLLGGVRDDDVMIQALQDETRRLGLEAMPSAIAARLQQEREERRSLLLDAMTSPRYAQLLNDLVSLTTDPPLEDREADRRASRRARSLVDKPWQKVRTTIKHLPSAPQDDDLHKVRRRVKQLRYAFEATAPVMNKRARRVERRADQLQELLGVQHDAVVTAEWLHRIALDHAGRRRLRRRPTRKLVAGRRQRGAQRVATRLAEASARLRANVTPADVEPRGASDTSDQVLPARKEPIQTDTPT